MLERRIKLMFTAVGGWSFKNRTGEELVGRCYQKYRDLFYFSDKKKREFVSSFLDDVDPNEQIHTFLARLDPPSQSDVSKDVFKLFEDRVNGDCKEALRYLNAFVILLEYEMNRPSEQWYGGKLEKLRMDETTQNSVEALAKEIKTEEGRAAFPDEVKDYFATA